jgi:hypothetical protein
MKRWQLTALWIGLAAVGWLSWYLLMVAYSLTLMR